MPVSVACLMLVCIATMFVGWIFYHRPGIRLWTIADIRRANEFLYPTGAWLWIVGFTVGMIAWVPWAILRFVR